MKTKHIVATVTNDLLYDQRMQRIASALSEEYRVTLVGRSKPGNRKLSPLSSVYQCVWLPCIFSSGKLFYLEYQIRLFFYLLFLEFDAIYAVDHDTLWGGFSLGWLRRKVRIYDAHEYFEELPELMGRPLSKKLWALTGRTWVPTAHLCITVNQALAERLGKRYNTEFVSICNMPLRNKDAIAQKTLPSSPIILYQGVLNIGRGLPEMISAMDSLPHCQLWLAGEGDLSDVLRDQATRSTAFNRIKFLGYIKPDDLIEVTSQATVGINLLENKSLNYFYSLANKFFDYIQAGKPQLTMGFPVYKSFMNEFEVGLLINELRPEAIAEAIKVLTDESAYTTYVNNCLKAGQVWHWESQVPLLLDAIGLAIDQRNT